ncbi:MAG TPA: class I mannose-6-phosphate isomerase [Allosphingosinicella sp.]|jgi:mannose-6-phosphate isomerase
MIYVCCGLPRSFGLQAPGGAANAPGEAGGTDVAVKLDTKLVEKPWGRDALPAPFSDIGGGDRIGEVWFAGAEHLPLLAKYIFTSEKLSIQVHPSAAQAEAMQVEGGKHECWLILDAEPGGTIGIGVKRPLSPTELRAAALDGSLEELIDWRPVRAGDFFYVPAGTVHAIGAGISLLEFQQNDGVTFRLYDYGRPRELHLDQAVAVARPEPHLPKVPAHLAEGESEDRVLVDGPFFSLVHVASGEGNVLGDRQRWVMPLAGRASAGAEEAGPGECLLLDAGETLTLNSDRVLIGAEGKVATPAIPKA